MKKSKKKTKKAGMRGKEGALCFPPERSDPVIHCPLRRSDLIVHCPLAEYYGRV
jgi:hypothetical protein